MIMMFNNAGFSDNALF